MDPNPSGSAEARPAAVEQRPPATEAPAAGSSSSSAAPAAAASSTTSSSASTAKETASTAAVNFPSKHQPAPPRGGFQLFAMEIAPRVTGTWTIAHYHNAWAELSEQERARYEAKGKGDAERYKREFKEWEEAGGADWVKRLKEVTDKGVLSTKLVGSEMRKVRIACRPEAVRLMATAVEAFVGTLAMESYVHTKQPDEPKKKVGLVDIHKLIHESDARFGFLAGHFEHPSIFGRGGKKKKSKRAIKAAQLAAQAALTAATNAGNPNGLPKKREKVVKPVHRPKLEHTNTAKYYAAKKPEGPPFETLSAQDKESWNAQFRQYKEQHLQEEERWKQDYPDEYNSVLRKRDLYRERSRKRKYRETYGAFTQGAPGSVLNVQLQPNAQMLTAQQQYVAPQQTQQQAMQYQPQMANQMTYGNQMDQSSMYNNPPLKRVIVEDPTVLAPWKKVQVVNAFTGAVEEVYYWNTFSNATQWDRPS